MKAQTMLTVFLVVFIPACLCAEGSKQKNVTDKIGPDVQEANLDDLLSQVFNQGGSGSTTTNSPKTVDPGPSSEPQTDSGGSEENPQPNSGGSGESQQPPTGSSECTCVPYYLCDGNKTIIDNGVGIIDIRIKDGPCDNYLDVCCDGPNTHKPDNPITPRPVERTYDCGVRNFEGIGFRITGANDNEAQYGEFPWMVAVVKPDPVKNGVSLSVYQCGGSLIHPQVVLTAAHCVVGKENLNIRAGEWDTQTKNELYPTQDRRVKKVIVHEQYYAGALYNDVALLILDSPVELAENVQTICLPDPSENMDRRNCVASGWGKDVFGKEGRYQVILKRVEVPIVPRGPCVEALRKTRLGTHFKLDESFICAGGQPGKDTCKGDGGSPLACPSKENPKIYKQAGIVAWGIDCGKATPGVYVNVPLFRNWIDNNMAQQNFN